MTPKRGEGAVKLRIKCGKCDCYLWRIYPNSGDNGERTALVCVDCDNEMGMRESATNRFGKFIIGKNAQFIALESSPSALIAAVEAMPVKMVYGPRSDKMIHPLPYIQKAAVLNLLRSPPTEEVA